MRVYLRGVCVRPQPLRFRRFCCLTYTSIDGLLSHRGMLLDLFLIPLFINRGIEGWAVGDERCKRRCSKVHMTRLHALDELHGFERSSFIPHEGLFYDSAPS